jgi:anti-sigma B factor antagonist
MEITRRTVKGVMLLDLTGALSVGSAEVEGAPLGTAIRELTRGGCLDIALNLAGLTHLDARGLGELVFALKTVRGCGGRLSLVAPSPRVRKLLAVTRLDTIFECYDSEAEFLTRSLVPSSIRPNGCAFDGAYA